MGSLSNLEYLYDIFYFFGNDISDCLFQGFVFKQFDGRNTNTNGIFDQSRISVWNLFFFHQYIFDNIIFFMDLLNIFLSQLDLFTF